MIDKHDDLPIRVPDDYSYYKNAKRVFMQQTYSTQYVETYSRTSIRIPGIVVHGLLARLVVRGRPVALNGSGAPVGNTAAVGSGPAFRNLTDAEVKVPCGTYKKLVRQAIMDIGGIEIANDSNINGYISLVQDECYPRGQEEAGDYTYR